MGPAEVELLVTAIAAMLSPTTLTFSVLALVLGEQPRRTGLWFYLGAFSATLAVGVVAAFALEDVAAAPPGSSQPKTWVSIVDLVFGAIALFYAAKLARSPLSREQEQGMVDRVSKLASSPAIAVVGAGAALANPGGFIPVALKDISQLNPTSGEFILLWVAFTVIALLPLALALLMLTVARDGTLRVLHRARGWLTRNASKIGAVLVAVLGVVLIRNGIVGLTG
jgi:hypothetical protein